MSDRCKICKFYTTANLETILKIRWRYGKEALCADHLSQIAWVKPPVNVRKPLETKLEGDVRTFLPPPSFFCHLDGELIFPTDHRRYGWRMFRFMQFKRK